jgi:hypothetical protein
MQDNNLENEAQPNVAAEAPQSRLESVRAANVIVVFFMKLT